MVGDYLRSISTHFLCQTKLFKPWLEFTIPLVDLTLFRFLIYTVCQLFGQILKFYQNTVSISYFPKILSATVNTLLTFCRSYRCRSFDISNWLRSKNFCFFLNCDDFAKKLWQNWLKLCLDEPFWPSNHLEACWGYYIIKKYFHFWTLWKSFSGVLKEVLFYFRL